MRQILPTFVDPVDPMAVYADLPVADGRPGVRLNMIASLDGATAVDGVAGGLANKADQDLFHLMRSLAKVENIRLTAVCDVWDVALEEGRKLADPKAATTKPSTTNAHQVASTPWKSPSISRRSDSAAIATDTRIRNALSPSAARCSALPWPYWWSRSGGRMATRTA